MRPLRLTLFGDRDSVRPLAPPRMPRLLEINAATAARIALSAALESDQGNENRQSHKQRHPARTFLRNDVWQLMPENVEG